MITRRGVLGGLAGILASGIAPGVIGGGILMPVREIILPPPRTIRFRRYVPFLDESGRFDGYVPAFHENLTAAEFAAKHRPTIREAYGDLSHAQFALIRRQLLMSAAPAPMLTNFCAYRALPA